MRFYFLIYLMARLRFLFFASSSSSLYTLIYDSHCDLFHSLLHFLCFLYSYLHHPVSISFCLLPIFLSPSLLHPNLLRTRPSPPVLPSPSSPTTSSSRSNYSFSTNSNYYYDNRCVHAYSSTSDTAYSKSSFSYC